MHFACCPIKVLYCFVSFSFISRREEGTAVEVALIFNGTSSETLPSTDDVAETLIRAVTDPNSTLTTQFNVTVVVDSIRVLSKFHCSIICAYLRVYVRMYVEASI